jgi:peptidoglycan/LPS O-acetylase OafA/YrhL
LKYRADIDGLRAFAVGIVVLSHLQLAGFGGGFSGVDIFFVISGFLITTYLVEQVSLNTLSLREFYFRRARRILPMALLVLSLTTGAAFAFLNSVKAEQVATDSFWSALFLANLHLIQQSADYFNHAFIASPVQHYWSLAVEEQFYLVFPLLLIVVVKLVGKASRRVLLGSIAGLVIALSAASLGLAVSQSGSAGYFSSATRAYELGIGALLACAVFAKKLNFAGWAANLLGLVGLSTMAAATIMLSGNQSYPSWRALFPTVGAALVILAGSTSASSLVSRLFSLRPLVFLGKISFSIYLIHWPLITFSQQLWPEYATSWVFAPAIIVTTVALAAIAYYLVERSTRRIQIRPKSDKPVVRMAFGAVTAILVVALATSAWAVSGGTWNTAHVASAGTNSSDDYTPNKPTPQPSSSDTPSATANPTESPSASPTASPTTKPTTKPKPPPPDASLDSLLASWLPKVDAGLALTRVPSDLSPRIAELLGQRGVQWAQCMDPPTHQTTCEYGPVNAKHTAVILGDSYALAVYPMVISALGLTDWKVIGLNQRECMVSDITPWPWSGEGQDLSCPDHRAWVNSYIAQIKPDLVVLSDQPFHPIADGNHDSGDNHDLLWQEGLDSALAELRPLAKNIVYFGVPTSQTALTDCVLAGDVISDKCHSSPSWLSGYINQQAIYSNRYKIPFINPNDWICSNNQCPAIIDKTPVYWDGAHFTQAFAAKLGPLFRAFLREHNLI